jgi:hypothetical protein
VAERLLVRLGELLEVTYDEDASQKLYKVPFRLLHSPVKSL